MTRLNFFLIPVLFYNFYVPGNTLPLIYHVWMYCTWSFCVAYSNTSFEFESRIRAAVNNM